MFSRFTANVTLARRLYQGHCWRAISQELTEEATMSRVKQASKQKRTTKAGAVKVLGAAGLSFSLVGSASASKMPTASIPQSDNTSPNQRFVLSEEEMVDVSLATFYVFDKENMGSGVQLARGCGGCGRGGGCGGCRGCWLPGLCSRLRLPWLRRLRRLRRLRVRWRLVRWLRDWNWRGLLRILGSVPPVLSPAKSAL
jgi:hypothetical protein